MSVAIATMGKFIPIVESEIIVGGGGEDGSAYGWRFKKPNIVVTQVYDEDDDIRISVTQVRWV